MCSAEIILGTETWLTDSIEDKELTFSNSFTIFRKDRSASRGGGVMIAVKRDYLATVFNLDTPLELLWVKMQLSGTTYVVGVCYRPPQSNPDFVDLLHDSLEKICDQFPQCIIILAGDFNYPDIDWETSPPSAQQNRYECAQFLRTLQLFHLTQLVHAPTRGNRILDLILTNQPTNARACVLEEVSDHCFVHCLLLLPLPSKEKTVKYIRNYHKADTDKMTRMLSSFSLDFEGNFPNRTADQNWVTFRDNLIAIEEACIPRITIKTRTNSPWFTVSTKRCLNRKKRAYRRAKKTNNPQDWQSYRDIATLFDATLKEDKNKYFNHTLPDLLKTDAKKFWRTVNPKATQTTPMLKQTNGTALPLAECANVFNDHFCNVFTQESPVNESCNVTKPVIIHPAQPITITVNGIARAIDRLPLSASPGPDGVSTKLLKITSPCSASLLSKIFQQSLDTGCVPADWKLAYVKPLFKSGDTNSPSNYRPISITSICCKLLEHVIYTHIMSHLNLNNLLFENQHGFRHKRSCQTQLFELVTDLHEALHTKYYMDAIFIDLSKAFDRVPHNRLLLKLNALELDPSVTSWIQNFLTGRSQSVIINNCSSKSSSVKSGVPQGSVLGPLLFLVYINDIAATISSSIRLFADDCVLYRRITTPDDVTNLQNDLTKLTEWCNIWQMQINTEKTKHMAFSMLSSTPKNAYAVNGTVIENVTTFKYLGVFLTCDLSWRTHIEYITNKALRKLGFLKRSLYLANSDTRLHAYTTLIRSSLEYASIIWNPHQSNLTNLLEAVQNKAARFILRSYSRTQSVSFLKQSLNLSNLIDRRKLFRLVYFHSLYHNRSPFSSEHIFPAHHISLRTDHLHKVSPVFARTEKFKSSPLVLSINDWNRLPVSIVSVRDPSLFEAALHRYLCPGSVL